MQSKKLEIIEVTIPNFITAHIDTVIENVDIQTFYNVEDSFKRAELYDQLTAWISNVLNEDIVIVEDKILTRKGEKIDAGSWHTDSSFFEGIEFYKCVLLWVAGPVGTGNVMFLDDDGNIDEIQFSPNKLLVFDPDVYHKSCKYDSNDVRIVLLLNLTKNGLNNE